MCERPDWWARVFFLRCCQRGDRERALRAREKQGRSSWLRPCFEGDPWLGNSLRMTILVGSSVDVVLLPVEGGVGLDDHVFVGGLLELVDQHGLAGFEGFRDFRM